MTRLTKAGASAPTVPTEAGRDPRGREAAKKCCQAAAPLTAIDSIFPLLRQLLSAIQVVAATGSTRSSILSDKRWIAARRVAGEEVV